MHAKPNHQIATSPHHQIPRMHILAVGYGQSVLMWMVAYIAMTRPGLVLGEVLFAAMLAIMFAGGVIVGRFAGGGWRDGILVGAVSAALNLLIVGSLISADNLNDLLLTIAWWVPGTFIVSMTLGGLGAVLARQAQETVTTLNWRGVFTKATVGAVLLLLITGGLVTSREVGLAVPDWPSSFGHNMFLYPLTELTQPRAYEQGIFYEHAHRLYGSLVGLTAIILAIVVFKTDRRNWLRTLAGGLIGLVIVQGIFGGTRVTEQSTLLAIIHGVLGQVVFAIFVAIAAFTSTSWIQDRPPSEHPSTGTDRLLSILFSAVLLVQLSLGAAYRHLQPDPPGWAEWGHITVAIFVTVLAVAAGSRAWGIYTDQPMLARLGKAILGLVCIQLILGVAAFIAVGSRRSELIPVGEIAITTAHQANGAVLLATAGLLLCWSRREIAPESGIAAEQHSF